MRRGKEEEEVIFLIHPSSILTVISVPHLSISVARYRSQRFPGTFSLSFPVQSQTEGSELEGERAALGEWKTEPWRENTASFCEVPFASQIDFNTRSNVTILYVTLENSEKKHCKAWSQMKKIFLEREREKGNDSRRKMVEAMGGGCSEEAKRKKNTITIVLQN